MSQKCIYCGNGYDEDFGHTDIVQVLNCSKISIRSKVYYGDGCCEKSIKSQIWSDKGMTLAKTVLKIIPERRCLEVFTQSGDDEAEAIYSDLEIICCPFCGRKFEKED